MLTLLGLFMMSCASSSQVGKTSSWSDEIYGSPAKPQTSQIAKNEEQNSTSEKKENSNYANLEQKYADVIEINMDSIKNDTVIYKAEDTNPYNRILSDSYQESYERRLRGLSDPYYGMENWSTYYSDNYWYAQAYDPYFYNIVVMGNQVWVEPRYISAMFGWPRRSFSVGFGFGFGWNYGYWNYDPWYWSYPYNYNHYGYNPYYTDSYWWGWNNGYWTGNSSNNISNNSYYGRRVNGTNNYTARRTGISTTTDGSQTVVSRRRDGSNSSLNPIVSTRRTQTRVTPTYESNGRRESNLNNQASSNTRRVDGTNTRRVSERPTREIGVSEPTRRTYNQSSGRTRTSTESTYRRSEGSQNSNASGTSRTSSGNRNSTPTYNRPERVSTPTNTTSSSRNNESYRQSGSDSRSSSSGSSQSGSRSSSSSSSSSSSGSNTRRR